MDDRIDEELFAEWLEFCAGRSEQEDWHFSGLLQGVTDPDTLTAVFARFPHADALQSRALDVLGAGHWGEHLYLQPAIAGDAQAVAAAARAWLDELARVAGMAGEPGLQATLRDVPVVAATAGQLQAAWRESAPAAYLHDVVCDVVREARTLDTPQMAALDEALYHIASTSTWAGISPSPCPRQPSISRLTWRSGAWVDAAHWSTARSWWQRLVWIHKVARSHARRLRMAPRRITPCPNCPKSKPPAAAWRRTCRAAACMA